MATRRKVNGNGHAQRYLPGEHGCQPLSQRTQRRLLSELLRRAGAGDVACSEALVTLGMQRELRAAMARIRLAEA